MVFPVSYNDRFYLDVLESGELTKLAFYNDIVVGAVCCRIDTVANQRRLYIMTLGCLFPYRRLGIGTVMLNHILNYVEADGNFDNIFLWAICWFAFKSTLINLLISDFRHVQVNNDSAIEFYKKFGFEVVDLKKNYYKRIEPADAYVLQKNLKENGPSKMQNGNSSDHWD